MNLYKAIGSIGGLTMVSRALGFVRDMIGSRMLGASHANDAFNLAFLLPNIFRRLFAEGAFSSGFVPLFSRRLASGGHEDAQAFSNEILSVFMPALLLVTIVFEIFMPGVILAVAGDYREVPGKYELAVELTRWTFPYLLFISLVALLSGILNSLTRFAIAAFAPALLNMTLIAALLVSPSDDNVVTVRFMSIAVLAGGILQFILCWAAVRRAGVKLHFGRPRMTPAVRELVVLILPATAAAGVYQISQLFYAYFSASLGEGALTKLSYADRLNQLPLSIIGTALGVAILPAISQSIARGDDAEAADVQARAFDLSMLLTLPATLALAIAAVPIIGALFQGGEYSVEAATMTGNILAILVTGLPAYVLVKVLTPAFYARKDVKTPVMIAMAVLVGGVVANFILIPVMGIYSLATVTSASAWLNFFLLFGFLYARGHFRMPGWLVGRVLRQLAAAIAMAAALYFLREQLADWFFGSVGHRFIGLAALVGTGALVYFSIAWMIGGMDREAIKALRRKRSPGGMRVVSGIQPTGDLHLGNLLGAILRWVRMQDEAECLFFLADLHALTVDVDPALLRGNVREMAAALIASGIDPDKSIVFAQSALPAHAELAWILQCTARMGWLERMTQFKEKGGKHKERSSVGLFTYPVLQAADVLLYQATHVPVGEDQKQHIELARDIAIKFNTDFETEMFVPPEPYIGGGAAARVMSLRDGSAKMSKTDPSDMSRINLIDDDDLIAQKIRKAKTDPEPLPTDPAGLDGRPEAKNLVGIYAAVTSESVEAVLARFAGLGFGDFKPALADALVALIAPLRQRLFDLRAHPDELDRILADGAEKARVLGAPTLAAAYRAVGLRG